MAGGGEKLPPGGVPVVGEVPVRSGKDPRPLLARLIAETSPEAVFDLSDEPVMDYRRRHELAAVALASGVPYMGPDFSFTPPPFPFLCEQPSIAVVGTGKRSGKTAVAAFAARVLKEAGKSPVMVAMGRGGPPEPEVVRGDEVVLGPRDLLAMADAGRHAASDYVEDALLARVPTVGCRRCGGGLANQLAGDVILLEGSGAAFPPVHADVTGLVIPASIPAEHLAGYMGPYRMLLADFAVVTMCEYPFGSPSRISAIVSAFRSAFRSVGTRRENGGEVQVVRTVFRPTPTRSVEGADAFVTTTAPEAAADSIRFHLEEQHGCRVVGIAHSLSDRERLEKDLGAITGNADLLLCEIKAAGIDVATRRALDAGLDVVYMDNVPVGVEGDDPAAAVVWAADLAARRFDAQQP
jgi:cyclic 2,3-diphosphoglycerate synthase